MSRDFELPVDVPKKSEIVQQRVGIIFVVSGVVVLVFFIFLFSINFGLVLAKGAAALPDIKVLESYHPNQSTRIFDRYDNLVANVHGDEDRVVIPLNQISPHLQRAVMAIEDNRFYQHNGIDMKGTARAFLSNAKGEDVQGGSTLTQQLVKNLFLTTERSYKRKLAEAMLAMRVEKHYSKNKILEMYLNQVYWGNQAYGIEKAARRYFKKPASELTIAQSSLLAGLLSSPEGRSPFTRPQAARKRQLEVLRKMRKHGYISREQYSEAANETISLNSREVKASKYPYFITFVIQQLVEEYGEDVVRRGGLRVYTTLDPEAQELAEDVLAKKVKNYPKYSNVDSGALVAIDVKKAQIIAMVGGVNFKNNQYNNATQAKRAAGSQFKPFVYLTGFRLGVITPDSPISDKPVSFDTGTSIWRPHNWDGRFMGAMNIRRALTLSRNTPTVQIGMRVGIDEVIKTVEAAGIHSKIDRNFSSLLGSSGIPPLEIATGFSTFARGGIRMYPTAVRRVLDVENKTLPFKTPKQERTLDPEAVAQLNSILVDVVEKGTGRSARLPGRQVAGKTGTTDKVRDVWFTGFTPDMVCTVWMGNINYTPLRGAFSFHAAQIWHDFSEQYYKLHTIPATPLAKPTGAKIKKQGVMVLNLTPNVPDSGAPLPELDENMLLTPSPTEAMYNTFDNEYDPIYSAEDENLHNAIGPPVPPNEFPTLDGGDGSSSKEETLPF